MFAISQLIELTLSIYHVVICVDSKSVLQSLKTWDCNAGTELLFEIKHLIHILGSNNTIISFCWIPSHCNIFWNDKVDILAKQGAKNNHAINVKNIPVSLNELKSKIKSNLKPKRNESHIDILSLPRKNSILLLKFRLNVWRTKYVDGIKCLCKEDFSVEHIFYNCEITKTLYQQNNIQLDTTKDIKEILNDEKIIGVLNILLDSPIANLF